MIPIHAPLLKMRELIFLPEDDYIYKLSDYFSKTFNKSNVVFTSDGRNAIRVALKAMGLKARDEVLIPGYICGTIKEVIGSICRPIYTDINSRTFNIDSSKIETNITNKTKAILVAHLYGNPCNMGEIVDIAEDRDIMILEDVAQALNGRYNNRNLGSFGDLTVFSFRFSKDITSFRGGALLTDKEIDVQLEPVSSFKALSQLSIMLASMKTIKKLPKSIYAPLKKFILFPFFKNSASKFEFSAKTLSNYQCYLLYKQLAHLDSIIEMRRTNAEYYSKQLEDLVLVPEETKNGKHIYYRYTIQSKKRDSLCNYLLNHGIEADKMYDYYLSPLENCITASKYNLNLPVHHEVTRKDTRKIVEVINEFAQLE